jgi:hypothetical protein
MWLEMSNLIAVLLSASGHSVKPEILTFVKCGMSTACEIEVGWEFRL